MDTLSINLAKLKHAIQVTEKGTKCILIPIAENNLSEGEKGGIYLNCILSSSNNEFGTHIVNQSVPKAIREALAAQTPKAYPPTLGNAKIGMATAPATAASKEPLKAETVKDELPF